MIKKKKLLLIGDSITEWGRFDDVENLGSGYVRIIHDYLKVSFPSIKYDVINKGIGGNRIVDLADRWEEDVITENPDILSISIGINDVWRQIDEPQIEQVNPEQFEQVYDQLLAQVKKETNAKIVLMEPTIIDENINSVGNQLLIPYVEATKRLAEKYQAFLVPTYEVFLAYLRLDDYPLTIDGVHMNSAGNTLMALTWLEVAKSLLP